MTDKVEIISRLLKDNHITVEEVMLLISSDVKEVQYIPYPAPYQVQPLNPLLPPWIITCDINSPNPLPTTTSKIE